MTNCPVQRKSRAGVSTNAPKLSAGDIHPTELDPVLVTEHGAVGYRMLRWGLPGYVPKGSDRKGQVIFNARCETAMDKPMLGWHGVPAGFVGAQHHRTPVKLALKPAQAWDAGSCCQYFNHP